MESARIGILYVALGAALWGIIGLFTRFLYSSGLSPMQITLTRCLVALAVMTATILVMDRKLFRIDPKDIWMFIGTGLFSIVFFNVMYFTTQQMVSLSIASVLLYTAPCFVMIMSMFLFKERITRLKILALILAFAGCVFSAGIGSEELNIGILFGILAGFGYALYSIFSKFALKKYSLVTILFYTFLIASLCLLPFCEPMTMVDLCNDTEIILNILGLGIISTVLPYYFYTKGLKSMDAGKASIIAFVEPMVATILSLMIGDPFGISNVIGIVLILGSVILLSRGTENADAA
ncbi:MAG: EamA family transporter [Thermoplasmata archaeon]|nr:EamA family transporter [Thermoplasmata archaeon]